MNPEELFDRLINNKISREEFELLLVGLDDEDVLARYELYLQVQFEKEVENHLSAENESNTPVKSLKVSKKYAPKKKKKNKPGKNYPIAAVIVLLIGFLFSVFFIISQKPFDSQPISIAKSSITPETINKSTPRGRKFRMTLDDGSFVHMNSVSSISYPNKFNEESRDIEIMGEAYFDIKRDETRPFNIKVKDYSVQVLGTSFNIQAYEDEEDFTITVASGKVKVMLDEEGTNSAVLEKNQKLIFNPKTKVTEILEVKSDIELSWREGILKFESTPLYKVEKILERWYGVNVILDGKGLGEKSITGTHKNKNLKAVIEVLTYATKTNYVVKDNSIIIKN